MHLVTREAMAIYLRHLKPGGVIVFQATNRYVDLAPVVERLAAEFGMKAVMVTDISPEDAKDEDYWVSDTDQIIVTNNARVLDGDPLRSAAVPLVPRPGFRIFTDDFHNLLRVLKW
jgi:flagellar biosynthesis component FlhA